MTARQPRRLQDIFILHGSNTRNQKECTRGVGERLRYLKFFVSTSYSDAGRIRLTSRVSWLHGR